MLQLASLPLQTDGLRLCLCMIRLRLRHIDLCDVALSKPGASQVSRACPHLHRAAQQGDLRILRAQGKVVHRQLAEQSQPNTLPVCLNCFRAKHSRLRGVAVLAPEIQFITEIELVEDRVA